MSFLLTNTNANNDFSSYECGFSPMGDARNQFSIIYYLVALLYLIFDLELVMIFPFSIIIKYVDNILSLGIALYFLIILTIGFIYEYMIGALDIADRN